MSDTDTDVDEREIPLLDPDAKVLSEVQEEFVKPHIDWCPVQIKLEKVVTTTTEHTCCWRTDDDHKIILGGEGCLTVSRNNGVEKVYKLWNIDLRVISGIAITSEKQLICVEDLYSNTKEVHTVNIPNGLPDEIELHCVNTLDIMDPVCLFVFDKLRYGVLCENSRIECYTLKNILLDREPAPSELIKLDIDISGMDTACATPDGNMVVTSTDNRCFHIYNINGDLLNTFSPSNTWNLDDDWHQIFWDGEQHRLFVQCFAEGVILASDNRVICTLKDGKCVREEAGDDAKSLTNISFCVSSEERMWVINGDTRNEVHIYTCDQESMAQAKTGRRKQCQPIAILEPNNGLCPREIIYSKTIHTKNEHNLCWESGDDDQIFLGGRNTITLLRNDETKITYHLWDHNLDVISALALTRAKQLICIKDHQDQTTAHVLDLTEDIKDGAQLSALTKLTVSDPIYIFAVNKMAYGILCRPKRIAVFTLRDILLDENPKVAQIIKVEFEISDQDTACATPDDKYCVTSWLYTAITIYNAGSELVYICNLDIMVGSGRENWLRIFLDRQCHRLFVQYCKDKIVVVSDNGFVCSLKDEQWDNVYIGNTELVENIGAVKHCVFGNKRMWCVGLDKKSVHVYDHATSQSVKTDHETTMRYVRQQEFTTPYIEQSPTKLEYEKTVLLTNKQVCCWRSNFDDGIFLGGNNTITTLTDEAEGIREIVYTLWDKNLTIISGLAVTNDIHLVCSRHNDGNSYMFTVDISKNRLCDTHLQPVNKFVLTNPMVVFHYDIISYGVICKPKRINFVTLDNILFGTACSRYIDLNHNVSDKDTACVTPDHLICVASALNNCVYLSRRQDSEILYIINIVTRSYNKSDHRLFVQCYNDSVVVASNYGSIHTYLLEDPTSLSSRRNKYDETSQNIDRMKYCVFNEKRLWIMNKDNPQMVHISRLY